MISLLLARLTHWNILFEIYFGLFVLLAVPGHVLVTGRNGVESSENLEVMSA
jgi:hypothetical protein